MKDSIGFCLIKPYMSPTQLLTRAIKSFSNAGLTLIDMQMVDLTEEQIKLIYTFEYPDDNGDHYSHYVNLMQSGYCSLLLVSGKDTIYKM